MPLPPDNVGERIVFLGCPSAAFVDLFVRPDSRVTTLSREWLSSLDETYT